MEEKIGKARGSLERAERRHGAGHLRLAEPLHQLGRLRCAAGHPAEASRHLSRCLENLYANGSPDPKRTEEVLNSLAVAQSPEGRYFEAISIYHKSYRA